MPKCLEFLVPVIASEPEGSSDGSVSSVKGEGGVRRQEMVLTDVHLVNSCCAILQVSTRFWSS